MKILHVLPYSPFPSSFGGALRIYNLLRQMTAEHEVSIAYLGREGSESEISRHFDGRLRKIIRVSRPWSREFRRLNQILALVSNRSHFRRLGFSPEMQTALNRELSATDYDIVQSEFSHMGLYKLETGAAKVLDAHNVEYDLHRRQAQRSASMLRKLHYLDEARKIHREEIDAWRRQDLIFTTSERDRDLIEADAPRVPKIVLPNGVDTGYFSPAEGMAEPGTIVFTGVMRYLPNSDGVRWFLAEILPRIRALRPGVKVLIVGAEPPQDLLRHAVDGVTLTGRVDDVRPYVNRAEVAIVPLRMGGGTRLKIVEAFAMRKPVVSTVLGAEGLDVADGESILLADEPGKFAEAVVALLGDPKLRARLAGNAYDLVRERYDWSVIGRILERAYADLLEGRSGQPLPRPSDTTNRAGR